MQKKEFKHLIIGAGIPGLYIALQLLDNGETDFVLLEKRGKSRGKQVTQIAPDGTDIELGSSIEHTKQECFFDLLDKLEMRDKVYFTEKLSNYYVYKNLPSDEVKKRYKDYKAKVKIESKKDENKWLTLEELSMKTLTAEEFDLFSTCYCCWYEVNLENAKSFFETEEKEGKYFRLLGGQQQLITRSDQKVGDKIIFHTEVDKVSYKNGKYKVGIKGDQNYICDNLYITTNLTGAEKIIYENMDFVREYLALATKRECLRWYMILRKGINLPGYIVGDFPGKWTLKNSDKVWLISYVDGPLAEEVNRDKFLSLKWLKAMKEIFGIEIDESDVENEVVAYWKDAYTVLKPEWYMYHEEIESKFYDSLVITSVCKNPEGQGWIEGNLQKI